MSDTATHINYAISWLARVAALVVFVGGVTVLLARASIPGLAAVFWILGGSIVALGSAASLFRHVEQLVNAEGPGDASSTDKTESDERASDDETTDTAD